LELNDNFEKLPVDKERKPRNIYKILFLVSIAAIGVLTVNTIFQIFTINEFEQQHNDILNQYDDLYNEYDLLFAEIQDFYDSTDLELDFMQNINYAVNYGTKSYLYWVKIPFETYFNFRIYKSHDVDRTSYNSID